MRKIVIHLDESDGTVSNALFERVKAEVSEAIEQWTYDYWIEEGDE